MCPCTSLRKYCYFPILTHHCSPERHLPLLHVQRATMDMDIILYRCPQATRIVPVSMVPRIKGWFTGSPGEDG